MGITLRDEVVGRILYEIKNGANYFRLLELRGIVPSTLARYIPLMEKEGLISVDFDPKTKKKIIKLNEARIEEINSLIEKYIDSEEEQILRSYSAIQGYNPERAKNLLRRLGENIGKHTSTTLDRHEGFRKFPSSIKDLVEEKK